MSIRLISFWRVPLKGKNFTSALGIASSTSVSEISHSKPPDAVSLKLKTSRSVADVLAAVQGNLGTMTHRHLVHALTCLFQIQKANKKELNTDTIVKDPAFGVLCQNLNKHAREMEIGDTIEAIKVLSYLNVPVDSLILQTLLQVVRCHINLMNIQQIMFLDFLLSQFDIKNHLVDALRLALPLAFQIQLPLELDHQDLPLLRHMLLYVCSHNLPDRCINNVVTGLLLHDKAITAPMARSIVWALCQINCTEEVYPTRKRLLGICCDIMVRQMDTYTYDDVLRTAAKLKGRILEKHPEFYQEQWFDAAANYVIHKNLDFEQGVLVARVLSRIAHTHLGLVAYLCNKAASGDTLAAARPNMLFSFVNCLSNNNYTPEHQLWDRLRAHISANPVFNTNNPALPWTKICLELASVNCYIDRVLEKVFSKEFLEEYLSRKNNVLDYLQLLTLHEAVRTFHEVRYELPEELAERARARAQYPTHPRGAVAEHLARALGGLEFVASNVVLPNGIVPDVVVCVQSGSPLRVATDGARVPLADLNLPPGTQVVCIMNFNQGCYSLNSNRLRGVFRLVLDILERQGFATVAFNVHEWLSTPPHERTPYLLREIGYRCGEDIRLSAT